jgi:hypothetical protein
VKPHASRSERSILPLREEEIPSHCSIPMRSTGACTRTIRQERGPIPRNERWWTPVGMKPSYPSPCSAADLVFQVRLSINRLSHENGLLFRTDPPTIFWTNMQPVDTSNTPSCGNTFANHSTRSPGKDQSDLMFLLYHPLEEICEDRVSALIGLVTDPREPADKPPVVHNQDRNKSIAAGLCRGSATKEARS